MERIVKLLCLLLALVGVQAMAQTQTLKVWGHDFTMTADGKTSTHLAISENDVVNYTAFNMTIVVPEGISVAQVNSGRFYVNDIQISPDRDSGGHTISCNMPDKKTIKIIAYSTDLYEFYPEDIDGNPVDELFTIGLVAAPTMVNGDYDIQIIDSKFVPVEGDASVMNETVHLKMTVQGGLDGTLINYTMSESGFGTVILPYSADVPEGLKAFECTHVENGVVQTNELTSIPANTPLLLSGLVGDYTFFGISEATEDSYTSGVLTGVMKDKEINSGYVLREQNEIIGFYPVTSFKPVVVPQYRCFLTSDQDLNSIKLGGHITDIDNIGHMNGSKNAIYDLQGKWVGKPRQRGVYVRGNQKVFVK